ncbi:MAG: DNA-processing protein DprA [Clostridiales bacterium]|nr:DNA-processing protein DprA [Clostridiales bacterium]
MDTQEKMHWMALQAGVNNQAFHVAKQIVAQYGSLLSFWHRDDSAALSGVSVAIRERLILMRKKMRPEKLWKACVEKKIGVLCCLEEGYPKELLHFSDCPVILYYYGKASLLNRPSAAIVGSRKSTAYGRKVAADFAGAFAEAGLCVVSGMAKGIDAAAHEGALAEEGGTIAVLGCGVDVPYPQENRRLYQRLREEGLILSEYYPGDKPLEWHFPMRNRIISGLGRFTLLVEGEARSGALITCDWAAEQGKDVWAIPGPVTNPYSIGPLRLIKDGAQLAITPGDILSAYYPERYGPLDDDPGKEIRAPRQAKAGGRGSQQVLFAQEGKATAGLSPREKKLYDSISYYPVHVDGLLSSYIAARYEKAAGCLYLDLTKLTSLRLIEKLPGEYYQRI